MKVLQTYTSLELQNYEYSKDDIIEINTIEELKEILDRNEDDIIIRYQKGNYWWGADFKESDYDLVIEIYDKDAVQ